MTKENTFSRRNFLKGLIGAGLLAAGGKIIVESHFGEQDVPGILPSDESVLYLRQIVTALPETDRVIMWQSEERSASPAVEYRQRGSEETVRLPAQDTSFEDDGVTNHQYTAYVKGLVRGNAYDYRVLSEGKSTNWHPLTAPSGTKNGFKCLIFPDSQSADYGVWEEIAQEAAKQNPDAEFFVNMGDIVDNGEDRSQWNRWFSATRGIIDRIPFVPVMGNHETYNREWKERLPIAYLNYFTLPENNSKSFSRYYYSFDYKDVHFIVLNTQWKETETFRPGLLEEQIDWLKKDAGVGNKKWKVVLMHKDVLQYRINGRPERKEGFSDVGENFMPIFDELGIDIVFTAHLHTYRDRGHIFDFRRSHKGPLYILTGVAGDVRYPGLWISHALDEKIAPQPETDNYLTMEVDEKAITVKCFLPGGKMISSSTCQAK